jgi:hypothetical protein
MTTGEKPEKTSNPGWKNINGSIKKAGYSQPQRSVENREKTHRSVKNHWTHSI